MSNKYLLPTSLAPSDAIICLLLVTVTLQCASAARVLAEGDTLSPIPLVSPKPSTSTAASNSENPALSFFMHDILGGSAPSSRVVAGNVANTETNNLPFSKPNKGLFPLNGGIPLVNSNAGVNNLNGDMNGRNAPFLAGAGGATTTTIISINGNKNAVAGGNNLPFVTAGLLPAGATLQSLLFGMITVIDDELTKGEELGSSVIGKAQGFHLASSLDGSSHTMAVTVSLGDGDGEEEEEDSISLFGVHRTAAPVSLIAVVGGTGKYADASGYAEIETLHAPDQHVTDGVETLLHISVYLTE